VFESIDLVRSRQAWILRQMRQLGGEGFMREHKLY
ncbi:hypothetical protein ACLBP3_27805, partial [Klebsiella pneumoniae]